MSFNVIYVALVLSIGVVDHTRGQLPPTQARCDGLTRTPFNVKDLLKANPFFVHYSINQECAISVSIDAVAGSRGHDGTQFLIQGNTVTSFDFTGAADNKSAVFTDCNSGERFTWYALDSKITATGGWFCYYSCAQDGISLHELICAGTDSSFAKAESAALGVGRGVPNFDNVRDARLSCNPPKFCNFIGA